MSFIKLIPSKKAPGEWQLSGGLFAGVGLLSLMSFAGPVKPLADVVGSYACCDRCQKAYNEFHLLTPFLLSEYEGSKKAIP